MRMKSRGSRPLVKPLVDATHRLNAPPDAKCSLPPSHPPYHFRIDTFLKHIDLPHLVPLLSAKGLVSIEQVNELSLLAAGIKLGPRRRVMAVLKQYRALCTSSSKTDAVRPVVPVSSSRPRQTLTQQMAVHSSRAKGTKRSAENIQEEEEEEEDDEDEIQVIIDEKQENDDEGKGEEKGRMSSKGLFFLVGEGTSTPLGEAWMDGGGDEWGGEDMDQEQVEGQESGLEEEEEEEEEDELPTVPPPLRRDAPPPPLAPMLDPPPTLPPQPPPPRSLWSLSIHGLHSRIYHDADSNLHDANHQEDNNLNHLAALITQPPL